jgi:cyanuric acid amidohydrolase
LSIDHDFTGNGCVNDFSRTLAAAVWEPLIPKDAVTIFSGGTEGVLSPHVTFILSSKAKETGLTSIVGHTRKFLPHEVGTEVQANAIASTVTELLASLAVLAKQVHLVLIKCPLLTSSKIMEIKTAGMTPVTTDTYESMALSRHVSAIGIASALGELRSTSIADALQDPGRWSQIASCSSGAELDDCHIFILASAPPSPQTSLRAASSFMADAIDANAIMHLLKQVKEEQGEVIQVFAKAEADPRGLIRGSRHTMNTDSDLHSTRHARAAVGGLIAGLAGDCQVYVSGGAEGQGPAGGGSLCVVYRVHTQ